MKMKTIVVGIDGSENSSDALRAGIELLADGGAIHVVTAFHAPSAVDSERMRASLPEEFWDSFDPLASPRGHLHAAEALLRSEGVEGHGYFVEDHPVAAILDITKQVDADLIIVGSRGLGQTTRFLRGSVSARIANRAKTSFMVIHNDDD